MDKFICSNPSVESMLFVLIEEFFSLTLYGSSQDTCSLGTYVSQNGSGLRMELGLPLPGKRERASTASCLSGVHLLSSATKITTWVRTALPRASRCARCSSSHTCMPSSAPPPACGAASSRAPSASTQVGRAEPCRPTGVRAVGPSQGGW